MTRIYKTARGKPVDMDKVKLSNETAIAVGNMRVNARGDLIGAGNEITMGRNQLMDQAYAVQSAPTSGYSPNDPKVVAQQQDAADKTKSKALHDLANGLITPTIAEPIVNDSNDDVAPPVATTPARGSLAGSVAKKAVVNQSPVADPRRAKGPTRI